MKIPNHAKKVFKGILFDVYQWDQEMFDGSTATFEALKRNDTAVIIPVVGGKIMVLDEEQPHHEPFRSLPGGKLEESEDHLSAAKRELLEETGYASEDWEQFMVYDPMMKMEWSVHIYIARDCKKQQEPALDNGEKVTPQFITFDEFLMLSEDTKFRGNELLIELLKLRLDEKLREEFKRKLFKQ